MTAVAIYTRLSHDATGEQTATHRQRVACEAFAALRGWRVVRVFEDVDLSAYQRSVVRPAYEEMLLAVRAKRIDGILAWKLDRFVRRSADFERLWETCDRSGAFLTSAMEPIDTSTDLGLALVRVLVAFASLESATTGVRLRAKFREQAEEGTPHRTAAAYGIKKGWKELEPEQADRLREAATRVLAGEGIRRIVLEWNERGVPTLTGARWSHQALRGMLLQPRLASLLQHNGEVLGKGNWPAIIDEATHERLKALLTDPKRRNVRGGGMPHLLSGVLRCGVCGGSLYPVIQVRDRKEYYTCPVPPKGCSRIAVRSQLVEGAVKDALFQRLHDNGFGSHADRQWSGIHEGGVSETLADFVEALKPLANDYYVRREISRAQFTDAREALYLAHERRLAASDGQPASLRNVRNLPALRRRWEGLDLDEQRAILRSEIAAVTVHRAAKRGRVFDPTRIDITWRDELMAQQRSTAWLTSREVMEILGIGRSALGRRVSSGELHPEKIGSAWVFRRHEVDRAAQNPSERNGG